MYTIIIIPPVCVGSKMKRNKLLITRITLNEFTLKSTFEEVQQQKTFLPFVFFV